MTSTALRFRTHAGMAAYRCNLNVAPGCVSVFFRACLQGRLQTREYLPKIVWRR